MSVFKREGSPYYQYDFLFRGRRCRGSTKLANRIAAGRYENDLRERLAKARAGILDPEAAPTLRECRERFLQAIRAVGRKPRTVAFYRTCLGNMDSAFGGKRLDEIPHDTIQAYVERRRLEGRGRAGRTVNCDLARSGARCRLP